MAVFVLHANPALVDRNLVLKVQLPQNFSLFQIVRMNQSKPGLIADRFKFGQGIAQHAGPAFIDQHGVVLHVAFPRADLSGVDNIYQALFRGFEFFFGVGSG